ncbi:MAG: hypothetical protein LBG86_02130 [Puniceicoccales bacterium]|nr:hypothetical protein [Puniceicoccales bacterium]
MFRNYIRDIKYLFNHWATFAVPERIFRCFACVFFFAHGIIDGSVSAAYSPSVASMAIGAEKTVGDKTANAMGIKKNDNPTATLVRFV